MWSQAQRKVLIEEFTNASCPPCEAQNPDFNALLHGNLDKVVPLKYQASFPGYDPMYAQNPAQVDARQDYYDLGGVPTAWIDGVLPGNDYAGGAGNWNVTPSNGYEGGPYGYNQAAVDYAYGLTTPIEMELSHSLSEDLVNITIDVKIKNVSAEDFSLAAGKLHVAVTEHVITYPEPPGSTAEFVFEEVMRKMYPSVSGTDLSTIAPGDSMEFHFEEALPDYIFSYGEIAVVAFVQDNTDKAVYQAEVSEPHEITNYPDASVSSNTAAPVGLCGATISPIVVISNEGSIEITSFDASYSIQGGDPTVQSWTGTLAPGASESVTFDEVVLPGGISEVTYSVQNVNGTDDYNNLNNNSIPDQFVSLSDTPIGTELLEDNEAYAGTYPTSAIVSPPIEAGTFGFGTFLSLSGAELPVATTDPIGGYGNSDRSLFINYYQWNPGEVAAADEGTLTYQKIDLSNQTEVMLSFDRAGAQYQGSQDRLQILVSEDCGDTWTIVHDIQGANLATVGDMELYYAPASADWTTDIIDLSAFDNAPEVNVQFKAISAWGNQVYLDNINLLGTTVGTNDPVNLLAGKVGIYPNPTRVAANIEFDLVEATRVTIKIYDLSGRLVATLEDGAFYQSGQYIKTWKNPASAGLYLAKITTEFGEVSKRINVVK
ncbi:MAG: hypothetical protein DHS20C18_01710 [Saprospiraceae bacterium]|nr:MAG: hypothetical protein DHS20C18_01710 [Saprospiraceae bacterium]